MRAKEHSQVTKRVLLVCAVISFSYGFCHAREWTDASGRHSWQAELFLASERLVVLRDRKGELHAVQVNELSDSDKTFVRKYLEEPGSRVDLNIQTWTMTSGLKVKGNVLGYKSGRIEIENRSGVPYVNQKRFREIDPVYQAMLPKLVAAIEDESLETVDDFKKWAKKLRREKRTFQVDGVLLKLESGDEYAVPLFLFSDGDREVLESGWRQWNADEATREQKEEEDTLIRAEAEEHQRREEATARRNQQDTLIRAEAEEHQRREEATARRNQQIQLMQLGLLAVNAGLTSLWEVHIAPGRGVYGRPMKVIVPANDSLAAQQAAMQRYPGYIAGSSRQISRR